MERAVEQCRETLAFLAPHAALFRSVTNSLDAAIFDSLMGDWGSALLALPEATLWGLPLVSDSDLAALHTVIPPSLHAFLHGCRRLSVHTVFAEVSSEMPAARPSGVTGGRPGAVPGLNPKKGHEVARLSELLANLNDILRAGLGL